MASSNVTIVVLGDIGRSPRMQYHAMSFLKEGFSVNIVGYRGSKPLESITSHKKCQLQYLKETPQFFNRVSRLILYVFKILWQIFTLASVLLSSPRPKFLLVQSPPAIPALAVCWIYCRLMRVKFFIDWHNYGFSIMALSHRDLTAIVKVSELIEGFFGRRADGNLCVTKAMKSDLMKRWQVSAVTLYDRPPEHFGATTQEQKETLKAKYAELTPLRGEDRPGLLVSSTSWTEDEDFSILLSSLKEYDSCDQNLPKLLCVITGKGPLREKYLAKVNAYHWSRVTVVSMWLEAEDYPHLLALADLGVSLHTSSSGLDLPMKVVDMFGCGLPVAALNFPCLNELVQHKVNGLVFQDSEELSRHLQDWFKVFPSSDSQAHYQKAIQQFQSLRWHDNWSLQALPVFVNC